MTQHNESIEKKPIVFTPLFKELIWGGNRILRFKNLEPDDRKIGESWEISTLPGNESIVESGTYKGLTINELTRRFGAQLLGSKVVETYGDTFPLMIKLIDANQNLSIQVHPDNGLAMRVHKRPGKTEMWYVIDALPGAGIYSGLLHPLTSETIKEKINDSTIIDELALHNSANGDIFFIPAGRIHAIGAGNLIAEIQEPSDITYRIYDYGRKDANGQPRELHTELAAQAINPERNADVPPTRANPELNDTCVVDYPRFRTRRIIVDGKTVIEPTEDSYTVLMCVDGEATLTYPEGETELRPGLTLLLPAVMPEVEANGKCTLLLVRSFAE